MRLEFNKGKQREFLLLLKSELKFSQRRLAKEIGVSRRCLRNWINEERLLPNRVFELATEIYPKIREFKHEIKEIHSANWGSQKGGKKRFKQLLESGEFPLHHRKMITQNRQKSSMEYLGLPETSNFFRKIKDRGVPTLPLLASLLLTDGYLQRSKEVGFTSKSITLTNIFIDLIKDNSKKTPLLRKRENGMFEPYIFDPSLASSLLSLSPSYTTYPKNQSRGEYLSRPQPTIDFLSGCDSETKILCTRLAMSSDGYITVYKDKKSARVYGYIGLSCAHPSLVGEWKRIFEEFSIDMKVTRKSSYWSGIAGLRTGNKKALRIFQNFGGFVNDVKVSRKSPRLAGVEKNTVLTTYLENKINLS